jgi:hypothetical protein
MRAGAAPSAIAPFRRKAAPRHTWHWACTAEGCTVTRRSDDAATNHENKTGHRMRPEDD